MTFCHLSFKLHLPIKGIIKATIFKQFCGGETLEEAAITAKKLNEFGVDVTAFIRQFTFGSGSFSDFPTYYLAYRRIFKPGNIRFGIGGWIHTDKPFQKPSGDYDFTTESQLDFRLGWEWKSDLSKRWQVYYGVDLRPSFAHCILETHRYHDTYIYGTETNSQIYGVAPLLGFRFRCARRLSLTTESSFSVNLNTTSTRSYSSTSNSSESDSVYEGSLYTSFAVPLSVIITFDI